MLGTIDPAGKTDDQVKGELFPADELSAGESSTTQAPETAAGTSGQAGQKPPETAVEGAQAPDKTGQAPESVAPKLLAGKFKDPDSLEKGYQDLEREFTRRSQELATLQKGSPEVAALRTEIESLKAVLAEEPDKTPEEQQAELKALRERMFDEPEKVVEELAERKAEQKIKQTLEPYLPVLEHNARVSQVEQFMLSHPDAQELVPVMQQLAVQDQTNGGKIAGRADWVERFYLMAKVQALEGKLAQAATGTQTQPAGDAAKLAAGMPQGNRADHATGPVDEDTKIKDSIFGAPAGSKRLMFDQH